MYDSGEEVLVIRVQLDKTPDGNVTLKLSRGDVEISMKMPPEDARRLGEGLINEANEAEKGLADQAGGG